MTIKERVNLVERFFVLFLLPFLCIAYLADRKLKSDIKKLWRAVKKGEYLFELQ